MSGENKTKSKLDYLRNLCSDVAYRDKILNSKADLYKEIFVILELRGFPVTNILNCPEFNLDESLLDFKYKREDSKRSQGEIRVSKESQFNFLETILDTLLVDSTEDSTRSVYIFTGITDFQKVRFIAFWLILIALTKQYQNKGSIKHPLWWHVKGGFDDKLRDDEDFKSQKSAIPILVLDNLIAKSSNSKIEKYVDLLEIFPHSNVFILGAGMNPLELVSSYLNVACQACIHADEGLITNL